MSVHGRGLWDGFNELLINLIDSDGGNLRRRGVRARCAEVWLGEFRRWRSSLP
jgi:hypothetical protein